MVAALSLAFRNTRTSEYDTCDPQTPARSGQQAFPEQHSEGGGGGSSAKRFLIYTTGMQTPAHTAMCFAPVPKYDRRSL